MTNEYNDLSNFRDAYLDYLEKTRDEPPALEDLPEELRPMAESFITSIQAARGVDPYASRPSIEQLLDHRSLDGNPASRLGDLLRYHLRLKVDPRALVTHDAASAALGLESSLVVQARGMSIRVVLEATSVNLNYALTKRAEQIDRVFGAFPESQAVLFTTMDPSPVAVIVDRGDVQGAIETPSGERRAPRLRRQIADAGTACELWLKGLIPEFRPLDIDLCDPTVPTESNLDPYLLASRVVDQVCVAGARAKIKAKRATWGDFGDREAQRLATIVEKAQFGRMTKEDYESHLNQLIEIAV